MMTIFTMAFAAVMFSGMVLCMGMFLKHWLCLTWKRLNDILTKAIRI